MIFNGINLISEIGGTPSKQWILSCVKHVFTENEIRLNTFLPPVKKGQTKRGHCDPIRVKLIKGIKRKRNFGKSLILNRDIIIWMINNAFFENKKNSLTKLVMVYFDLMKFKSAYFKIKKTSLLLLKCNAFYTVYYA